MILAKEQQHSHSQSDLLIHAPLNGSIHSRTVKETVGVGQSEPLPTASPSSHSILCVAAKGNKYSGVTETLLLYWLDCFQLKLETSLQMAATESSFFLNLSVQCLAPLCVPILFYCLPLFLPVRENGTVLLRAGFNRYRLQVPHCRCRSRQAHLCDIQQKISSCAVVSVFAEVVLLYVGRLCACYAPESTK